MTAERDASRTVSGVLNGPWRVLRLPLFGVLAIINGIWLYHAFTQLAPNTFIVDWWLIEEAADRIGSGTMYDWEPPNVYTYSPLIPYVVAPLGLGAWRVLHFAALLLLPRKIAAVTILTGPFWFDVANGNFLTFAFVCAWLALSGSRWGMAAYFALTILIPRPLMFPVAAWLLWRRPESRPLALAVAPVLLILTAVTGELVAWFETLTRAGHLIGNFNENWSPSRLIGWGWIPIGIALGVWLTSKGRLGLASLAVSPYVIPYYVVMGILELHPLDRTAESAKQNSAKPNSAAARATGASGD